MMNETLSIALQAGAGAALVVVFTYDFLFARPLRRRLARQAAANAELAGRLEESHALAARVLTEQQRLKARVRQLSDRQGQLELRGEGRPYDQAISLASRGLDADRLAANFGLSPGEASLLALLHAPRGRARSGA